jgi:hypothetical protein
VLSRSTATIAAILCVAAVACGGSSKDLKRARAASYDAELPVVLEAVAQALRANDYDRFRAVPAERAIKTAWHPLPMSETVNTGDSERFPGGSDESQVGASTSRTQMQRERRKQNTHLETHYFIRFDVVVEPTAPGRAGGPWKVVVTGQASEWDGSTAPMPLEGAETPYWLKNRIEKLEVAIYHQLRAHEVLPATPPGGQG